MVAQQENIVLIQDTREQRPWSDLFTSPYIVEALPVGDYSVAGLSNRIAIERKSLPDLLGSLTKGRERFEKELALARKMDRFYVLIESNAEDVLRGNFGNFGKGCYPKAIWESIQTFSVRYAPFMFAGDRQTAARMAESLLLKYAREFLKTADEIRSASKKKK